VEHTYEIYIARLAALLRDAPPGAILLLGSNLGATWMDSAPVWFDLDAGVSGAADFDRSAWDDELGCWDGETPEETWGALEKTVFA